MRDFLSTSKFTHASYNRIVDVGREGWIERLPFSSLSLSPALLTTRTFLQKQSKRGNLKEEEENVFHSGLTDDCTLKKKRGNLLSPQIN